MTKQTHAYKFHLLLHSADLVEEYLRVKLLDVDLTPKQARVIKALHRMSKVSQVDLAREFNITAASMSTMSSRLMALDLIKIEKDAKNAKRNLLSLTAKGIATLDDISRVWLSVDDYIEELIGSDDQNDLASLTLKLRNALGGKKPGEK